MNNFKTFFLIEGGAGGHMAHPFDLPNVKNGKDLIKFFNKAYSVVQQDAASLKIDGVNVSLKLVGTNTDNPQFALDRGSMKELDVKGITIDKLGERFGEGHGMLEAGSKTLNIMNKALPSIKPELEKLGFFKDPNLFFNMEYVKGQTNVLTYDHDFLAIHGVNKFVTNPTGKSRAGIEVGYDEKAFNSLVNKTNNIASEYNFKVYGDVPVKDTATPNYKAALNHPFTIVKDNKKYNETLEQSLLKATNPVGKKIILKDGKVVDAMSRGIYDNVLAGYDVNAFIKNPKDYQTAIDGAVIYHGTRVLGDALLRVVSSDMGTADKHEGIVLRNKSLASVPVKITGSFIVNRDASRFTKPVTKKEEDNEGDEGFNIDTPNRPANTKLPSRSVFTNPPYQPGDNGMYMTPKPYGPTEALVTSKKLKLFNELTNMVVGNHAPFNRRTIILYPGRFQPFSKHHEKVFQALKHKFPQAKVYLATSDRPAKFDPAKHFLNFDEKLMTAIASGIDPNDVIKTSNPYQAPEIVNRFPKEDTILILAVGEKDMKEDPRFSFNPKKNGNPSYFQPFKKVEDCETLDKHAYILSMPTESFKVMGQNISSATTLRDMYVKGNESTRKQIITELYGKYLPNIKKIFDEKFT